MAPASTRGLTTAVGAVTVIALFLYTVVAPLKLRSAMLFDTGQLTVVKLAGGTVGKFQSHSILKRLISGTKTVF